MILSGEQGSAKSTAAQILRSLIDPANPMTRSAPQSEQDLVIAARHNHVLSFDNLSYIKPSFPDALCRIATGSGFATRKLHTNSEEVLFDATRPCLPNGIPDLASRPDLADRSIIVSLPVISETNRKYENSIWDQFNAAAPSILVTLLGAISTALARRSSVHLSERPRMADFTRWVTAAEPALGWPVGAFQQAYTTNRRSVDSAAIEGNPVAEAVLTMIIDHGPWQGTATELIRALRRLYPPGCPRHHQNLTIRHLSEVAKKAEMFFAYLKRILGLGWLRLLEPCGANDEFLHAATAQNLRKLAVIFSALQKPALMM